MREMIQKPESRGDFWHVMSIMLYPTKQEKRKGWIEAAQYHDFARRRELGETAQDRHNDMGLDWVCRIREFPTQAELKREENSAAKGGTVAGDMLLHVYLMALCGIEEPSLRKANYIVRSRGLKYKHQEDPDHPAEVKVNKFYSMYRPVAHLWGAVRLNDHFQILPNPFKDVEDFAMLLSMARTLQEFAISHIPLRSRDPLISKGELYCISDDISPGELGGPPNKQYYEEILKKYSASTG